MYVFLMEDSFSSGLFSLELVDLKEPPLACCVQQHLWRNMFLQTLPPATRLQKLVNMTSTCMKTLGWSFIFCFVIMQLGFDQILPSLKASQGNKFQLKAAHFHHAT